MKSQFIYLLFSISLLTSCNQETLTNNGFDHICSIYTTALENPKHKDLTLQEKLNMIDNKITKQVEDTDALQVYSAVKNANPDEKYKLFKESAEYVLKRQWDCPVMVDLNTQS